MNLLSIDPKLIVGNRWGYGTVDADIPAIVWHDGSPTESGTAVTAATITETADTSITCKINAAVDTRIGAANGVITDTGHLTWGDVADAINIAKGWHCQLIGAHRAAISTSTTSGLGAVSEVTCFKTAVSLLQDTSDLGWIGAGITNAGAMIPDGNEGMVPVLFGMEGLNTTGAGTLSLWECNDKLKTEFQVWSFITAAATLLKYPAGGATGAPIYVGSVGSRLVGRVTAANGSAGTDIVSLIGYMVKIF